MARRVFFSFYYDGDVLRVGQIRNSGLTKLGIESAGFIDHADWEAIKQKGKTAIKNWIDDQLQGSSVTVVLIGEDTASREWVEYEIKESYKRGNGLFGIYIHNVKDLKGNVSKKGRNPITQCRIRNIKTYDWVRDDGYGNINQWVENAYKQAREREKKVEEVSVSSSGLVTLLGVVVLVGTAFAGIASLINWISKNRDNS